MFPSSAEWHVPCLIRSLKKTCICTCSQLATQSDESNPNSQGLLLDFFGDKFTNSLTPCLAIRWKQSCRDRQQIRGFVWGNPQASSFKLKVWAIDGWAPLWACRWNKRESGWVYRNHGNLGCILYLFWNHHITRLTPLNYLLVWRFYCTLWKCLMASWISKLLLNLYQWFGERPHNNPHIWNPHK